MSGIPIDLGAKPRAIMRTHCRGCAIKLTDDNARRSTWSPQGSFVGLCRPCEATAARARARARRARS